MISVLFLGFLIGLQHALEADHVAAVASLATRARSAKAIVRLGAVWGLGHSITLLFFGGLVLLADWAAPEKLAQGLEFAVGVMLILLGAGVLYRLYRERVHFHAHRHGGGVMHMHAHSHAGERRGHDPNRHEHEHPKALPLRSLLVGMMHGLAGSAALLLLALSSVQSVSVGIAYILLFGLGSIVGMAALSAVIAVPLGYSARALTWAHHSLQAAVGCATILIGGFIVYDVGIGYVTGA
jgi:ABC-type nickel/cobalt efflux system permease component RcnA